MASIRRLRGHGATQLLALSFVLTASLAIGQTTTYNQDTDTSGSWHVAENWSNGIPNAIDAVAILNQPISTGVNTGATYTLSLGGTDTKIGSLTSNNASNAAESFRTAITQGRLIFEATSGPATLNENLGASEEIESRLRIQVPVQLNSNLIINSNHALSRNTLTELTQRIDGAADRTITKEGFGNIQLSFTGALGATDGFFGDLIINNGGVRMIIPNGAAPGTLNPVFSKASGITVNAGGQLQFGNGLPSVTLGPGAELKLNGTGKVPPAATITNDGALRFDGAGEVVCSFNSPVNLQSASHISVAAADSTGVLTQEVRGVGQLQKTGNGLLKLTAANTYSGGTRASNGALAVNNADGSGVGAGDVTILGAILGGTGFIGSGGDESNVTLTGGTLAPGDFTSTLGATVPTPQLPNLYTSPGVLSVLGGLAFDAASSMHVDLTGATVGSQYDQLVASGVISLGGATLNLSLGSFVPTGAETFTLINNTGAAAIDGQFGNYAQGAEVDLAGVTYYINYMGGSGNDVVLGPTPPSLADADFDDDDDVDGHDFLIWQRGLGTAGGQSEGNANGDGTIDAADLAIWKSQFGTGAPAMGAAVAIPEPAAASFILLAALAASSHFRRSVKGYSS